MAFTPQFLDELRGRLTLSDYVGKRVRLKKKGREHLGLCPFHNEKTPSFTVNDSKAFYHCFGCGAHGSAIDWVMQMEGLSFPEAVERLAGDAGMAVPQSSPEEQARAKRAKSLYDANEAACAWFEKQLYQTDGAAALDYLRGRGLTEETIARFRLGFAPESSRGRKNTLGQTLQADGYTEEMLIEAGLIARPDDGRAPYDRFRGRVIFPITDRRGRVIAFGGRIMEDREGVAKYLNSPETPLFHKGRTLYALALAREAAANDAEVIVTEGYMDVIALHQAGFGGAVAPLGTAVTEEHIQALWRLAPEPVLCFDGDNAGQRAAHRAAERVLPILKPKFSTRFSRLPAGDDPDSVIRTAGVDAFKSILASAVPLVDFIWNRELEAEPTDTPERRAGLYSRLLNQISGIQDKIVQNEYRREVTERYFAYFSSGPRKAIKPEEHRHLVCNLPVTVLEERTQQIILLTMINHPEVVIEMAEDLAAYRLSGEFDALKTEVISFCMQSATMRTKIDHRQVFQYLKRTRVSQLASHIIDEQDNILVHGRFALPHAQPTYAKMGILHAVSSHYARNELSRQLDDMRNVLVVEFTQKNNQILYELAKLKAEMEGANADAHLTSAANMLATAVEERLRCLAAIGCLVKYMEVYEEFGDRVATLPIQLGPLDRVRDLALSEVPKGKIGSDFWKVAAEKGLASTRSAILSRRILQMAPFIDPEDRSPAHVATEYCEQSLRVIGNRLVEEEQQVANVA